MNTLHSYTYGSAAQKIQQEEELKLLERNRRIRRHAKNRKMKYVLRLAVLYLLLFAVLSTGAFCSIIYHRSNIYIYESRKKVLQEALEDNAYYTQQLQEKTSPYYVKERAASELDMIFARGGVYYVNVQQEDEIWVK